MRSAALLAAVLAASTAAALVSAADEATSEAGGEAPSSQQSVPLPPQPPPHGPLPHVFPQPPPFGPPLPQPPPPPPPRPVPQPPICQLPTLPWLFPEWRRPESILWSQFNCDDEVGDGDADVARVVDFACCHDDHCDKIEKRHQCRADITCQWKRGRCTINRDKESNVCCRGQVHEYCVDLVAGRCPLDFQVPAGCCNKPQMKYNNVLKTNSTDLVCCNTPCTDMKEKDGCQLPDRCSSGPEGRSLFGGGGGGRGGSYGHGGPIFNKHLVSEQSYGHIIPYTGFEDHDYLPTEFSHVPDAEEITVDDLMHSLVEALSNDKDAYEYNSEVYSDPYTGKVRSGGERGGISFPDPGIFLSQIYGNHYGSALGQLSYYGGGIGYGSHPYSIAPQDIHGPGYFDPIYPGTGGFFHGGFGGFGGGFGHGGGSHGHGGGGGYGNQGYGNQGYGNQGYSNQGHRNQGWGNQGGYGNQGYGRNQGWGGRGGGYGGAQSYGNRGYQGNQGHSQRGGYGQQSGYGYSPRQGYGNSRGGGYGHQQQYLRGH